MIQLSIDAHNFSDWFIVLIWFSSPRNGIHIEGNKSRWIPFSHHRLLRICSDAHILSNIWWILRLCEVCERIETCNHQICQSNEITFNLLANFRKSKDDVLENQEIQVHGVAKKPLPFGSSSMNEYLLGSRKLKPFPVAMSLVARYFLLTLSNCVEWIINLISISVIYRAWQYWGRRQKSTISVHNIG